MTAAIHPQAIWPQTRPDAIFWSSAQRQTQTQSQTFQDLQQPQPQQTVVSAHEHQRQLSSTWQNATQNPQHYSDSAPAVRLNSAPVALQVPQIYTNAPLSISNKQIWSSPWDQQGQANVPEPSTGISHIWQQMAPPCPVRADVPTSAISVPVVGSTMPPAMNQYGVQGPSFGAVHPLASGMEMDSNAIYTAQAPLFAPRLQFATWQPARQLAPGPPSNREVFVHSSSYSQNTGSTTSGVNLPATAPTVGPVSASALASASSGCDYNEETMYSFVSSHAMRVMEPAVGRASAAEFFAFHKFVARTLSAVRLTRPTLFLALVLLDRHCSAKIKLPGAMCSPRWLVLAVSLMLANKLQDDNTYTNLSWSKATGLSLEDLNSGERAWLCASNHALYTGAGGLYSSEMDRSQETTSTSSGASASAWSYSDWDTAWHASTPSQTVTPSVQASPRTPSSLVVPEPISPYTTCSFAPSPSHHLGFPTFPPGLIYN